MSLMIKMGAFLDATGLRSGGKDVRAELAAIAAQGKITTADMKRLGATLGDVQAVYAAQRAAQTQVTNPPAPGPNSPAKVAKLAAHEVRNLSFQMNDVAVMLASGQSPFVMMMQQGGQIAQIFGERGIGEVLPALKQGILSLISPTTLFLAGITAAGYAAYAVFDNIRGEIIDTDAVLERHSQHVKLLKDAYEAAKQGARTYAYDTQQVLDFLTERDRKALEDALSQTMDQMFDGFVEMREHLNTSIAYMKEYGFKQEAQGNETTLQAIQLLEDAAKSANPDIRGLRNELVAIAKADPKLENFIAGLLKSTEKALELKTGLLDLENDFEDMRKTGEKASQSFLSALDQMTEIGVTKSDVDRVNEIYAAMVENAQHQGDVLNAIAARDAALARIEQNQRNARIPIPTRRPSDFSLEADGPSDYEKLMAARTRNLAQIKLEIALIGASRLEQERAYALMDAEIEIREKRIDLASDEAQSLRSIARETADLTLQLERQAAAYDTVTQSGRSMIDGVTDSLVAGELDGLVEQITSDLLKTGAELSFSNPLKNLLYGDNLPTMSDAGGPSGFFARLFGMGRPQDGSVTSSIGSRVAAMTTASMSVTASNVMITGGGNLSSFFSPANQNQQSLLDLIGHAEGTDRGRGYNETLGYGKFTGGNQNLTNMSLDQIDALQSRMLRHPDNHFNSSALGRYQIVQRTLRGLREEMGLDGSQLFSADLQDQLATRLFERRGASVSGLRNEWEGLRNIPDGEILAAFNQSSKAVESFGSTALAARGQLGSFGDGLGNLASAFASVGSGGGSNPFAAILAGAVASPGANQAYLSGAGGLFDKGGFTGGNHPAEIVGFVHGKEFVFDAKSTARIGVGPLEAMRQGALKGYQSGGYVGGAPAVGHTLGGGQMPPPVINMYDSAGVNKRARTRQNDNGGFELDLYLEERVNGMIASGKADDALEGRHIVRRKAARR